MKHKKIAVLMGGWSHEREVSFRSGKRVLESLKRQGYNTIGLDASDDFIQRLKDEKVDLAYIMLHGRGGEDGIVQAALELAGVPYTGSKVLASALAMHKITSKRIWQTFGIPTPKYQTINADLNLRAECEKIKENLSWPVVVKPTSEGSSLGVTIVKKKEDLEGVVEETIKKFGETFAEEFIAGKEVTVGILGKKQNTAALPVLELLPRGEFYDFHAKYTEGETEFILPARLEASLYKKTQEMALAAHKALGCHGWSRVDIIVSGDKIPFVHELNSIPGMTERSDLPAEAEQAGISFDELVVKILESALP